MYSSYLFLLFGKNITRRKLTFKVKPTLKKSLDNFNTEAIL